MDQAGMQPNCMCVATTTTQSDKSAPHQDYSSVTTHSSDSMQLMMSKHVFNVHDCMHAASH
jgi:hypothetical protein